MLYYYKAKDSAGEEVTGSIEAPDQDSALQQLSNRGLWPTGISAEKGQSVLAKEIAFLSWVPSGTFNAFLLQLSVMLKSGVPLTEALASLETGETNRTLRNVVQSVRRDVEKGNSFSDALSHHPHLFDAFFVNMVRIGETGGVLEKVLIKLTGIRQRSASLRNQIIGSVAYPAVLMAVVAGVLMLLFSFVLPRFSAMFQSANVPLPWPTELVLNIGDFVQANFTAVVAVLILTAFTFIFSILTRTGRWVAAEVALRLPVFNRVVRSFMMVHISEALSMLLNAGVPLLELLSSIEKTLDMPTARNTLSNMRSFVEKGSTMRLSLEGNRIFSPMALKLIETGEKTGNLDDMFEEIASYYDDVLQASIKAVLSLVEPFLIFIMAGVVGFIIFSVILPVVQMSGVFRGL